MSIVKWPENDRPINKLITLGAKMLTDAELLAVFLHTGIRGKSALAIAQELLVTHGGLHKLLNAYPPVLLATAGLGKTKYARLQAALELGTRYHTEILQSGDILCSSAAAKSFLSYKLRHYPHEVFACLFLNSQQQILSFEEVFQGTIHEATVYPREIIRRCLVHNAAKIILAHNHPSGNPQPSQADQEITQVLQQALCIMDIQLLDHIIVGKQNCVSLKESGLL